MKSLYAIGGIGAVGCLVMSFMMQHLLKVKSDQGCGAVATELAEMAAEKLSGRPTVEIIDSNGLRTMVIRVRTRAGVDRGRFALGTGRVLWLSVRDIKDPPAHMRFLVEGDGGDAPLMVEVPSPGAAIQRPPAASGSVPAKALAPTTSTGK